jgi:hypothetical protein
VKLIYLRLLLLEEVAELRGDYVSIISSDWTVLDELVSLSRRCTIFIFNLLSFDFYFFNCKKYTITQTNAHSYETTIVEGNIVKPSSLKMQFKTGRKVGKTGVMLVGLGGNNGW